MAEIIYVTGIDTDAGKSYSTGWLGRTLARRGNKVLTQKLVQTGNIGRSEDIDIHRAVMGEYFRELPLPLAAPQIFSYPASPHLASEIDGTDLDFKALEDARDCLSAQCDTLLIECAGGPMVPLTRHILTIDYIADQKSARAALVTNGRLGSISHTLLAVEALKSRGIDVAYVLYNSFFDGRDEVVSKDGREFIRQWTSRELPDAEWMDVPSVTA